MQSTLIDNSEHLKLEGRHFQVYYSLKEEIKHFNKVDRKEAGTAETPIMPFIAELRKAGKIEVGYLI